MAAIKTVAAVSAFHTSKEELTQAPKSTVIPRGDVTASLNYFHPPDDGSHPYHYGFMTPPEGVPVTNFSFDSKNVSIVDLRGKAHQPTLDVESFKFVNNFPNTPIDFTSNDEIKADYYPEVKRTLLEHVPGAKKVVIFDHIVRHSANTKPNAIRPAYFAHVDQTSDSAEGFVRRYAGDEAESLLQGRYRFINVWKPLTGPVNNTPLAFASSATVAEDDFIPFLHYFKDKPDEDIVCLRHREEHQWFYLSGMDTSEVVLLQLFDSAAKTEGSGVKGGRAPHSAFRDARTPADAEARYSIEVRVIVFGD